LWLTRIAGFSSRDISSLCSAAESDWLNARRAQPVSEYPLSVEADLPQWVVDRLLAAHDADFIRALGRALQEPAPLDLRVNTLRGNRDAVLTTLNKNGL